MRVSTRLGDPDYVSDHHSYYIMLDGDQIFDVIEADEEKGEAVVRVRAEGHLVRVEDHFEEKTVYGKVTILKQD